MWLGSNVVKEYIVRRCYGECDELLLWLYFWLHSWQRYRWTTYFKLHNLFQCSFVTAVICTNVLSKIMWIEFFKKKQFLWLIFIFSHVFAVILFLLMLIFVFVHSYQSFCSLIFFITSANISISLRGLFGFWNQKKLQNLGKIAYRGSKS